MPLDRQRCRPLLREFRLRDLFVDELGWDRHSQSLEVTVDGNTYQLSAIAQKAGLVAFECPGCEDLMRSYPARRKVETQVSKSVREHLIVYTDPAHTTQIWQWVKREIGRPAACREHIFRHTQPGDSLLQKLEYLVFTLEDEERGVTVVDSHGRVRHGFDVERVTKRFYDRFKAEHAAFLKFVKGIPGEGDQRWYVSVTLNRLMFIYFLQKKGFLDGDAEYLRHKLEESQRRGKDRFYRDFLCPLFFDGFAKRESDRGAQMNQLLGSVPYLNGGIFMKHKLEQDAEQRGVPVQVPDAAFVRLFDFFDVYHWHLDERPLRADNEINPDVLGYIFEKYINAIQPGEQKAKGAYYTQEDITGYISRSTVLPYLLGAAKEACAVAFEGESSVWRLLQENPDRYIHEAIRRGIIDENGKAIPESALPDFVRTGMHDPRVRMLDRRYNLGEAMIPDAKGHNLALPTETWREYVVRRQRCLELRRKLAAGEAREANDLIIHNLDICQFAQDVIEGAETPDQLLAFWRAVAGRLPQRSNERFRPGVAILDPTCGSGAFLFAALNLLQPLYQACLERMAAFLADLEAGPQKRRPRWASEFGTILQREQEHPNPRYFVLKTIIINNLFGVDIMEEAVEICKLRLFLKLVAQLELTDQVEPLPDIDFNVRAGNTLVGFATRESVAAAITTAQHGQVKLLYGETEEAMQRIEERMQDVDRQFALFRQQQTQLGGEVTAADKAALWGALRPLEEELNQYLAGEYGTSPKKKAEYRKWLDSHRPFHWFLEFHEVMARGGFDVIIGNPPYVEYRLVRSEYTLPPGLYEAEAAANLYAFCMERSASLLRQDGCFGMIVPTGVLALEEMSSLRGVLAGRYASAFCSTYAIRPSKLFDGVDHRLCVYLGGGAVTRGQQAWSTWYNHWHAEERDSLFAVLRYAPAGYHKRLQRIPQVGCPQAASILDKLESASHHVVASYSAPSSSGYLIHYHRSPRYWIRSTDFAQYFRSPTRQRSVHHFRDVYLAGERPGKVVAAALNSSLFFLWFLSIGNGRNLTGVDVLQFPIGDTGSEHLDKLPAVFDRLMLDYQANSFVRTREDCEFQEFRPSLSKPIMDEVDGVLTKHYGFTDEELDFIINYDIKYRMGRDAGEERDGA